VPTRGSSSGDAEDQRVGEWVELNEFSGPTPHGAIVVLSFVVEKQGNTWIGRCTELGTATYGRSRDYVRTKLISLVRLYLNVLENTQRERVFNEQGVVIHWGAPRDIVSRLNRERERGEIQLFHAYLRTA
jgi:hypothetical protein